jgi:hypothetical protein
MFQQRRPDQKKGSVMRITPVVQDKIAELALRVLEGRDGDVIDIGEDGAQWLLRNEHGEFTKDILAEWIRRQVRNWISAQARDALGSPEANGQMVLPLPDLPPYLEVAPGVKKHQRVMTRRDWLNTLAIYRNRREQAEILCRQIERAWQQIDPLLPDDGTTVADIADRLWVVA